MFHIIVNMVYRLLYSIIADKLSSIPVYNSAMQSKPTVDQINKMNWFPVDHKWYSIGESLGISKGVMEEIFCEINPFLGFYCNSLCDIHERCIKAMLVKWLNEAEGTGHSERTWITIAKAVKNVGFGDVAFELLEKGMYNLLCLETMAV